MPLTVRELRRTWRVALNGWHLLGCCVLLGTACTRAPGNPTTPPRVANTSPSPHSPSIQVHDEAPSAAEFILEETGFPAISDDGRIVALAFHELQDAGPPKLELTVQFRSASSGAIVYESEFREPYTGELGKSYLDDLRGRLRQWLRGVEQKLAQAHWVTMSPVVTDEAAVCSDPPQPIRVPAPPLEVRFNAGHLVVLGENSRVLFDHKYPEWTTVAEIRGERCVFLPYVSQVAFDAEHQLLVIRASPCSPSDLCTTRVLPRFAIVPVPPAHSH